MTAPFLDTNVLVYAVTRDHRSQRAKLLLRQPFAISVQILNEFALVLRRKLAFDWTDIEDAVTDVIEVANTVRPVTLDLHIAALRIASRYQLRFFDAVVAATALRAGCDTLYSEDMHHGLVIDNRLTIRNPFLGGPS